MDNHIMLKAFITQFSGKENIIAVNSAYCRFVGNDLAVGAFLSQLIYWSDKSSRKDGFFYKTRSEWQNEIFLADYTIRKATKQLIEMGILETKTMKANGSPTTHYRVNMENFLKQFSEFLMQERQEKEEKTPETIENSGSVEINKWNLRNQQMELLKSTNGNVEFNDSITEITTKTTSENKKDIVEQSSTTPIPFFEIVDYLNKQTNSRYKAEGKKTKSLINARWNEGYKLEDFKHVIDVKTEEWINTDMEKYLCPDTLFSTKFEKYVNQKLKKKKQTKNNSSEFNPEDLM